MYIASLDFAMDLEDGQTVEEFVTAWVKEFAPNCTIRVDRQVGRGSGHPEVELASFDKTALRDAVHVYTGGDEEQTDFFMEECVDRI